MNEWSRFGKIRHLAPRFRRVLRLAKLSRFVSAGITKMVENYPKSLDIWMGGGVGGGG